MCQGINRWRLPWLVSLLLTEFVRDLIKHAEAERLKSLRELVDITRQCLRGLEGDLWVLWAAAQQVSAHQKVQRSIRYAPCRVWPNIVCWPVISLVKAPRARILSGFLEILTCAAEYWMDLGKSTVFQGRALIDCVWRIHNDILKIWNFNDPLKVCWSSYPTLDLFRWYISSYFRERFFSQKWSSSSNRLWNPN